MAIRKIRKTIEITKILDRANNFLRDSSNEEYIRRMAISEFVETLLFMANAYAGYSYLASAKVNYDAIKRGECFEAEDDSRRFYHFHQGLK